MAVKTDMNKAYDRLEWGFLLRVLKANGFNSKVCTLLMECVTTVRYSILLNGAPLAPLNPKRGLRQGDPLSPFLFILCSEVLSKLIRRAEKNGDLIGVRVARNTIPITHLFYANDPIFFCSANAKNADALLKFLHKYERWSGQRVSNAKSGVVFSPNTKKSCREEIKGILGFNHLNPKEKYLESPFFFSAKKRNDFLFLKDKILGKLEGWKAKYLSQAGRTTLVSSVLQSIPNYFMSTVKVPSTLCEELDRVIAKFWSSGCVDKKNYCALRSCNELCQPKRCGGLGFRRLKDMNLALLAKLCWMVMEEKDKPWVKLLRGKYCKHNDVWASASGKFSVKSAYWLSQKNRFKEPHKLCEKLWKIELHPRLKHFCWRLFSDILPTKNKLGFLQSELKMCEFYHADLETALHLFCQCTGTRALWFRAGVMAAVLCESIWQWRNDCIFKGQDSCKVDASIRDDEVGCALIKVNENDVGNSLVSLSWTKVKGVLEGELLSIALALRLAKENHASAVRIETDSLTAATAFNNAQLHYGWETFALFSHCLNLCKSFDEVSACYVKRENNVLADMLARWARVHKAEATGLLRDVAPSCGY
ncbi:uncharacterized protein LOC133038200 [Cannabis sativa]|uniref:uncharacterized protein LOC133038200 n=1 Tax=Cannabis sativa TaxID=3483 RepID=UPI0029C9F80E|nr:uncharacterized protein LOC133038200 [Cannabis sativa]